MNTHIKHVTKKESENLIEEIKKKKSFLIIILKERKKKRRRLVRWRVNIKRSNDRAININQKIYWDKKEGQNKRRYIFRKIYMNARARWPTPCCIIRITVNQRREGRPKKAVKKCCENEGNSSSSSLVRRFALNIELKKVLRRHAQTHTREHNQKKERGRDTRSRDQGNCGS